MSPEDGRKDVGEGTPGPLLLNPSALAEARRQLNLQRLHQTIEKAMEGQLHRDRPLKELEVQKLSPVHVNMALDRAAGYSISEIGERYEYQPAYVSFLMNHPDMQYIIRTVLSMASDKLTDVNERIKALSQEALDVKVAILRESKNEVLKEKVANDLLDRAGYGARKQIDINSQGSPRLVMQAQAATSLTTALEESKQIATIDYRTFLRSQGGEVASQHLQLSAGHTDAGSVASPVAPPRDSDSEEEAAA